MSLHGVEERSNLPAPEVSGEQQNSLAALLGGFKVFKALVDRDLRDIGLGVTGKEAGFAEQAPQRYVDAAQDSPPLGQRLLGERELEIAQTDSPQARVQPVHQAADCDAYAAGKRTG